MFLQYHACFMHIISNRDTIAVSIVVKACLNHAILAVVLLGAGRGADVEMPRR